MNCLFGAPWHFLDEESIARYRNLVPTAFVEIWKPSDLPEHRADFSVWITHPGYQFLVDESVLDSFPSLELLVTASTGTTHIDVEAVRKRGIALRSLLDLREALEEIAASAEYTFLLLLNGFKGRGLPFAANEVASGRWREAENQMRGFELQGKTVGLIGYGRIGRRMRRYCEAFGAKTLFYDPYQFGPDKVTVLEELLANVDAVVVCCALTNETRGFLNEEKLRLMRDNVVFINTARGEIVDEESLASLIRKRPKMMVGLDVVAGESDGTLKRSPLLPLAESRRITIVPHIAGATTDSQRKAADIAFDLVEEYQRMKTT